MVIKNASTDVAVARNALDQSVWRLHSHRESYL